MADAAIQVTHTSSGNAKYPLQVKMSANSAIKSTKRLEHALIQPIILIPLITLYSLQVGINERLLYPLHY